VWRSGHVSADLGEQVLGSGDIDTGISSSWSDSEDQLDRRSCLEVLTLGFDGANNWGRICDGHAKRGWSGQSGRCQRSVASLAHA
jgi:hypothetical protein